ncbi:hypothetical protein LAZ67_3003242 [Cordylochernes scorpioides]|uniref:Uncharacterized protein n=1 Tax=Cordylochernes scorpioides TaxID=51811 RepID=A0ABY6K8K0_9ARAC|nr:hypothetical protein LAZ67_3003242 [Cordylochernes scorpioides]
MNPTLGCGISSIFQSEGGTGLGSLSITSGGVLVGGAEWSYNQPCQTEMDGGKQLTHPAASGEERVLNKVGGIDLIQSLDSVELLPNGYRLRGLDTLLFFYMVALMLNHFFHPVNQLCNYGVVPLSRRVRFSLSYMLFKCEK